MGDVVGRGQFPGVARLEAEGKVLAVVVAILGHDVEDHAAKGLADGVVTQLELGDGHEQLGIGVGGALLVVEVAHGAERLHVVLDRLRRRQCRGRSDGS